jgi:hypothetical protein
MGQIGGSENDEQIAREECASGRFISKQAQPIQLWDESDTCEVEIQENPIRRRRQNRRARIAPNAGETESGEGKPCGLVKSVRLRRQCVRAPCGSIPLGTRACAS